MLAYHPGGFSARDIGRYFEKFHRLILKEPPQPLTSGPDAAAWRLLTWSRECIAKVFRADQLTAVRTEIDLTDYLRQSGVRTPTLLEDSRGQRVGLIANRWRWRPWSERCPITVVQLEQLRRVYTPTVTRDELTVIAQGIGVMHQTLQAYPRRSAVKPMEHWQPHMGRFEDLLRSANAALAAPAELARWRALDHRMEQTLTSSIQAPTAMSVLHGDLGLEHVRLVHGSRSPAGVYLFDFSDFSYGPVIYDLATMLSRLYWENDIDLVRWGQLRDWLLHGYESAFALSDADRGALDAALIERLLIEVRYLNRMALKANAPFRPDGVRKRYQLAEHVLGRAA